MFYSPGLTTLFTLLGLQLTFSLAKVQAPLIPHSSLLSQSNINSSIWLELDFSENTEKLDKTNDILSSLLDNSKTASTSSAYEFNITGSRSPDITYFGNWSLLEAVVKQLPHIQTLYWESPYPIPASILALLTTHHPTCRLHYTLHLNYPSSSYYTSSLVDQVIDKPFWDASTAPDFWGRRSLLDDWSTKFQRAIIASPKNLYALKVHKETGEYSDCLSTELLLEILTHAPNLRGLDLRLHRVRCFPSKPTYSWSRSGFNFQSHPHARFAASLEILRVRGFPFHAKSDGYGCNLNYPEWWWENDMRTNLGIWLQVMDWSRIHTLEISPDIEPLEKLRGWAVPSLRHLSLRAETFVEGSHLDYHNPDRRVPEAISAFVGATILPLRTLELWNVKPASWREFFGLYDGSGAASWRELESFMVGDDRNENVVDGDAFVAFMGLSPQLKRLDVSMERSVLSLDDDVHSRAIAASSSLEYLTLRFPTPDIEFLEVGFSSNVSLMQSHNEMLRQYNLHGDEGDEMDSKVNQESVLGLFRVMRQAKVGKELVGLEVRVGNWEDRSTSCEYSDWKPMVRVARYRCFIDDGEEICEGSQTRSTDDGNIKVSVEGEKTRGGR